MTDIRLARTAQERRSLRGRTLPLPGGALSLWRAAEPRPRVSLRSHPVTSRTKNRPTWRTP